MMRVTCACGKSLQAREELAGKRVRCPGCGEALTVPAASSAAVRPSKPRPPADDEPARPRRPTKQKAGMSPALLWSLVGGGAALAVGAVVLVIVLSSGGGGGSGGPAGPPGAGGQAGNQQPAGKPVPIKLHAPRKVGDRREVYWTWVNESSPQRDENQPRQIRTTTVVFKGQFTTRAVDARGMETEAEVVAQECTVTLSDGKEPLRPVAAGTVLTYTPLNRQGVGGIWEVYVKDGPNWSSVNGGNYVTAMFKQYGEVSLSELDAAFGTDQPQAVGGTWPARPAALWSGIPARKSQLAEHSGTVKLAEIVKEGGAELLVVEAELSHQGTENKTKLGTSQRTSQTTVTLKVPAGAATGPVHVTHREADTLTSQTPGGRRLNESTRTLTATSRPVAGAKGGG